jgi:2-C-methyl-D-erythritol 4-phosphate cytidylyltransferase
LTPFCRVTGSTKSSSRFRPNWRSNPPSYLDSVIIVEGGERRQDSVANAFGAVAPSSQIIVIHDAARPLVSSALIERTIDAASKHGAAIAALQARDTVKRTDGSRIIRGTIPREEVFLAQTPQAFRVGVLRDALALASTASDATDEAMLAEQAGHSVYLVDGDPRNLKITTPRIWKSPNVLRRQMVVWPRSGLGMDMTCTGLCRAVR